MRLSLRVNKSVVAVVALTAGVMLAPATTTTASAAPPCCGQDFKITYYSTSAKTTIVGVTYDGTDCNPSYMWGQETPYYTTRIIYCATSVTI